MKVPTCDEQGGLHQLHHDMRPFCCPPQGGARPAQLKVGRKNFDLSADLGHSGCKDTGSSCMSSDLPNGSESEKTTPASRLSSDSTSRSKRRS